MIEETSKERQKRYLASKCQNLIKEYKDILLVFRDDTLKEYSIPIPLDTSPDIIGVKYAKQEGAREAINLFIKKIFDHANE